MGVCTLHGMAPHTQLVRVVLVLSGSFTTSNGTRTGNTSITVVVPIVLDLAVVVLTQW